MTTELTKTGKVTSAVLAGVLGLGMVPAVSAVAAVSPEVGYEIGAIADAVTNTASGQAGVTSVAGYATPADASKIGQTGATASGFVAVTFESDPGDNIYAIDLTSNNFKIRAFVQHSTNTGSWIVAADGTTTVWFALNTTHSTFNGTATSSGINNTALWVADGAATPYAAVPAGGKVTNGGQATTTASVNVSLYTGSATDAATQLAGDGGVAKPSYPTAAGESTLTSILNGAALQVFTNNFNGTLATGDSHTGDTVPVIIDNSGNYGDLYFAAYDSPATPAAGYEAYSLGATTASGYSVVPDGTTLGFVSAAGSEDLESVVINWMKEGQASPVASQTLTGADLNPGVGTNIMSFDMGAYQGGLTYDYIQVIPTYAAGNGGGNLAICYGTFNDLFCDV